MVCTTNLKRWKFLSVFFLRDSSESFVCLFVCCESTMAGKMCFHNFPASRIGRNEDGMEGKNQTFFFGFSRSVLQKKTGRVFDSRDEKL